MCYSIQSFKSFLGLINSFKSLKHILKVMLVVDDSIFHCLFKRIGLICFDFSCSKIKFNIGSFIVGIFSIGISIPIIIFGFLIELLYSITPRFKSRTDAVVSITHYGSLVLVAFFTIVMAGLRYKNMGSMYSYIESVKNTFKFSFKWSFKLTFFIFLSFIIYLILFVMDYMTLSEINPVYFYYTPIYFFRTIFFFSCVQMCLIASKFEQLFHVLNSQIINTLTKSSKEISLSNTPTVLTPIESFSFFSLHKPKNVHAVGKLCDLHWILCKAIGEFNNTFGVQLAFQFFSMLIHLIDSPFYAIVAVTGRKHSLNTNYYFVFIVLMWGFVNFAQLCALVITCGKVTKAANDSTYIVSKAVNTNAPDEIKKEVKSFLICLNHHSADISPLGLFTLHESVITAVTSAVTTYLVILVQFQSEDE